MSSNLKGKATLNQGTNLQATLKSKQISFPKYVLYNKDDIKHKFFVRRNKTIINITQT